jgi:hypothetical protein
LCTCFRNLKRTNTSVHTSTLQFRTRHHPSEPCRSDQPLHPPVVPATRPATHWPSLRTRGRQQQPLSVENHVWWWSLWHLVACRGFGYCMQRPSTRFLNLINSLHLSATETPRRRKKKK